MKILIDTDWFSAIQDLQPSKQKEVLMAILNYPNGNSDTNLWKKTILPNLEKGQISYFNKLQNLKQNNPQKSNKKNPESVSESDIGSASESGTDTTIREEKSRADKSRFNEDSIIYVNGQYFDEFPPESIPLLKKHWSLEELEDIRKKMAFKPEHQTTVAQMLVEYPPKPKTTRFVKPTVEEVKAYCEERNNGVDPNDFVNHYDSKGWMIGKSPMKDWKAAVRTWESRNRKPTGSTNVNFAELVMLWNAMAERLNLDKVDESDLMPERKAEIEKIITIKKPKDLKTMFAQLEKIISDSPKLRGWHDILGADGHWITKQLNWKANFAFCFSTKGWCDIMGGKYNGDVE